MRVFENGAQFAHAQKPSYFIGVDLGRVSEVSALAVMERSGLSKEVFKFECRHLERWKARTSYQTIVSDTQRILSHPEIQRGKSTVLAIDSTIVGPNVIELFKREQPTARLESVFITGGNDATKESGVSKVPKRDLVSTVQIYLQGKRLKIAEELPEAEMLVRELQTFTAKNTSNENDTYGSWREGGNDDLIFAVALALWSGNQPGPPTFWSF
jgi:hypothetical protein